jgi:hypothetical protein
MVKVKPKPLQSSGSHWVLPLIDTGGIPRQRSVVQWFAQDYLHWSIPQGSRVVRACHNGYCVNFWHFRLTTYAAQIREARRVNPNNILGRRRKHDARLRADRDRQSA